jgi:hypothetical protein
VDQSNGSERQEYRRNQYFLYLRKLNDACLHDPYLSPFTNAVLENVGGQETYLLTNGFSRYRQIKIG